MPARRASGFWLLWNATLVSNLGDGVRLTALPLLATELTDDARLIAGVAVAERLPWVVFILPGGAWADRYDRRLLRLWLDVSRGLIVAALAVLVGLDAASVWLVYAAAALMASAESIVDSSSMALVPSLVDDADLERAGGRLAAAELAANGLIGPPLGGVLFAAAFWLPFGLDAASFVLAAVLVASIGGTFRAASSGLDRRSLRSDIAAGMGWLWRQPLIRNLALISTALGTISYVSTAVLVVLARQELGLGSIGFGVLLLPGAIGGVAGSLLAGRLTAYPLVRVLTGSISVAGLTSILIATSGEAWMVAGLLAVSMSSVMVWNVLTIALRQRTIPDELLGRVSASYRFLVYFGMPVGALAGGMLAESVGVRETFALAGAALLATSAVIPLVLRTASQPASRTSGQAGQKAPR